jgi:hypothetical protein
MLRRESRIAMVGALAACACAAAGACSNVPAQKPVQEHVVERLFREPPPSLAEAVQSADAVLSVRVDSSTTVERSVALMPRPVLTTEYRCLVLEVFKGPPELVAGGTVTVSMDSGEKDRGTYIERRVVRGDEPLKMRDTYVLFLAHSSRPDSWVSAYGPFTVWDTTGNVLRCARMSHLCSGLAEIAPPQLAARLRGLK